MIDVQKSGAVATVELCAPERRNALSISLLGEVSAAMEELAVDETVSVVLLHGGRCFSAGLDRDEMQSDSDDVRSAIFAASKIFHRSVVGFPKPLIAAIDGYALGTGLDLAVMADIRIATARAQLGHPEIALGGVPLVTPLKLVVGDGWARRLCFDPRPVDATEALAMGLISEIVERPDDLLARAGDLAEAIARAPLAALSETKRLFLRLPDPEEWLITDHDEVFENGRTIRRAIQVDE